MLFEIVAAAFHGQSHVAELADILVVGCFLELLFEGVDVGILGRQAEFAFVVIEFFQPFELYPAIPNLRHWYSHKMEAFIISTLMLYYYYIIHIHMLFISSILQAYIKLTLILF